MEQIQRDDFSEHRENLPAQAGGYLARRLNEIASTKHIPVYMMFELTNICNEECIHCYRVVESRREFKTADIIDVLHQLAGAGTLYVTFTGGEVTLRKDFIHIMQTAKKLHFAFKFFSNAMLIDDHLADQIAECAPYEVGVSIYGVRPETHDAVTQVPGSLEQTLAGIRQLLARGVVVKMKCPVMHLNINEYPDIISMAEEMGCKWGMDPSIVPKNDGCTDPLQLRITYEQLKQTHRDKRLFTPQLVPEMPASQKSLCDAGRAVGSIGPYGDVYPCLQLPVPAGNLREKPFKEIWETADIMLKLRGLKFTDLKTCPSCNVKQYCNRCPGMAYLEDGNLFGPSSRCCDLAQARKDVSEETFGIFNGHQAPGRKEPLRMAV